MLRARTTVTVRSLPVRRSGETNGKRWDFLTVETLDEDFNKLDVTLSDDVDSALFAQGAILELTVNVTASGGRLRTVCIHARDAKRSASAAA